MLKLPQKKSNKGHCQEPGSHKKKTLYSNFLFSLQELNLRLCCKSNGNGISMALYGFCCRAIQRKSELKTLNEQFTLQVNTFFTSCSFLLPMKQTKNLYYLMEKTFFCGLFGHLTIFYKEKTPTFNTFCKLFDEYISTPLSRVEFCRKYVNSLLKESHKPVNLYNPIAIVQLIITVIHRVSLFIWTILKSMHKFHSTKSLYIFLKQLIQESALNSIFSQCRVMSPT